jgi:DHA1 family inner membrane transport protein
MFCVFTYIAPILERVTRVPPRTVTWVLVVFGVGITLGNLIGGKLADWHQMAVILGGFVLLIAIFFIMPFAEPYFWPAVGIIFLWGVVHFAAASPLQARIVEMAVGAPNLASTLNQGAFNLGNALGAALGGLVLTAGYNYRSLSFASAFVASATLLAGFVAFWLGRRNPSDCSR